MILWPHWDVNGIQRFVFSGNLKLLCSTNMFPAKTVATLKFDSLFL
jgi:hypothetical protein